MLLTVPDSTGTSTPVFLSFLGFSVFGFSFSLFFRVFSVNFFKNFKFLRMNSFILKLNPATYPQFWSSLLLRQVHLSTTTSSRDNGDNQRDTANDNEARSSQKQSFIEKVKLYGANALLGKFTCKEDRFDHIFKGLHVTAITKGTVSAELLIEPSLCNAYSTLHGGAISSLVDIVGTMALLTYDPLRPGVSVELNVSFLRPAKVESVVSVEGRVLKSGKLLGFTEVVITQEGSVIAVGRHTKAF